jgi:hypothetical protein
VGEEMVLWVRLPGLLDLELFADCIRILDVLACISAVPDGTQPTHEPVFVGQGEIDVVKDVPARRLAAECICISIYHNDASDEW